MMMTGTSGCRSLIFCSSSSPDPPGMRMSLTTTCGVDAPSAPSASCAEENILNAMSSRASAFSNTQRMERSSSMIQTGFMVGPAVLVSARCALIEIDPRSSAAGREAGVARLALELDRCRRAG